MSDTKISKTTETAEQFADELMTRCFDSFAMLSAGLGSKLGLFDLMAKFDEPKTSSEIAEAAGFKERYVREWLGVMVSSHIINMDESGERYFIQEHRKEALTHPGHAAVYSRALFIISQCQNDLEDCFKIDGPPGLPYSSYPGIHEIYRLVGIEANSWEKVKNSLKIAPGLLDKLEAGISACELGTGSGLATIHVAENFSKSDITGLDISEEAIASAKAEAEKRNIKNAHFKVQDICDMPDEWSGKWDLAWTFDVAHDVPFTTKMLKEVYRTLKPGGIFLLKELDVHSEHKDNVNIPMARMVYAFSLFHCMPVSLSVPGGEGLGAAWGMEDPGHVLRDIGFNVVGQDGGLFYCKKPE